ncbi:unnamed protein product [Ectocarpus sp. 12 AP-2014]
MRPCIRRLERSSASTAEKMTVARVPACSFWCSHRYRDKTQQKKAYSQNKSQVLKRKEESTAMEELLTSVVQHSSAAPATTASSPTTSATITGCHWRIGGLVSRVEVVREGAVAASPTASSPATTASSPATSATTT